MNDETNVPNNGGTAGVPAVANPFGQMMEAPAARRDRQDQAMVSVEAERAMKEVEAGMVIAHKFPRDEYRQTNAILAACARPTLAEAAIYSYPRGGTQVEGPSIRLAEAIAQRWGNIQSGVIELARGRSESTAMAFAWDLESNYRETRIFTVPHFRWTRDKGMVALEDPRDIYEMIANQGARRKRACILAVVPGDVVEAALEQCRETQRKSVGAPDEAVAKMVSAFEEYGVTKEMIARRLRHHLQATTEAEILQLKRVYRSIRDGMAKVSDFFEAGEDDSPLNEAIRPSAAEEPAEASSQGRGQYQEQHQAPPQQPDESWPRQTPDGKWVDSAGELYDSQRHGWSGDHGKPAVKQDGTFKARRGTGRSSPPDASQEPPQQHSEPPQEQEEPQQQEEPQEPQEAQPSGEEEENQVGPTLDQAIHMFRVCADEEEFQVAQDVINSFPLGSKERNVLRDEEAYAKRRLGLE